MLKLASWNVNSLKVRLEHVLQWMESTNIDILALQETKLTDEFFPVEAFQSQGYEVVFAGQKTYNGVAIISRYPMIETVTDMESFVDPQRRILAVTIPNIAALGGEPIRLLNLYVPNGASLISDKYRYKLDWLDKMTQFIREQLTRYSNVAVVGDFNIAPEDKDVHDPMACIDEVLVSPAEREAFAKLLQLGLSDSFRNFTQEANTFSWWDYRAAGFRRNRGFRIDHILLSTALNTRCLTSSIDPTPRGWERPSDHAPVWVNLSG